ncbi:hypothetical protein ACE1TI_00775 [Alteribacillus sp. JSM 102045]
MERRVYSDQQQTVFEELVQETVSMYHCFISIIENRETGQQLQRMN